MSSSIKPAGLALLTKQFAAGCPSRLAEIAQLTSKACVDHDAINLRELYTALHKLAGSAGIFGFHRTGEYARAGEILVDSVIENGNTSLLDTLPALLADIASSVKKEAETIMASVEAAPEQLPSNNAVIITDRHTDEVEPFLRELASLAIEARTVRVENAMHACTNIDTVIVDVEADGDGYEVCRRISELASPPKCRILFHPQVHTFDAIRAAKSRATRMIHRPSDLRSIVKASPQVQGMAQAARILSVEDDADCANMIQEALRSAGHFVRVLSGPDLLMEELEIFHPELLLLDCDLPTLSGIDLARVVRADAKYETLPIVFCTSRSERFDRRVASRVGGDDFITKPFTAGELVDAVNTHLDRHRALRKKLDVDPLTELLNRTAAIEGLDELMAKAHANSTGVLVCILDIDNFKLVNDEFGHSTGDFVLRAVATHVRTHLRGSDIVGRIGGEEFVVGMAGATPEKLVAKLDAIRKSLEIPLKASGGLSKNVTFSAGAAWFPGHGKQATLLMKLADLALYSAKNAGRNRVVLHGTV